MREFLRRFLRLTSSEMQQLADSSPISVSQCHVLLEIGRRRESTVGELACYMDLDKSTLSRTVDVLIDKKFADREPFPNDRRFNRVFLTEEGQDLHASLNEMQDARIDAVLSRIAPERRVEIQKAFGILVDAFETTDREPEPQRSQAASSG